MTDPRRQRFAPYIRELADRMRLRDWTIELQDAGVVDTDNCAEITFTYGKLYASIRLSDHFLGLPPDEQRQTITHELVHCHMECAWEIAIISLPPDARPAFRRMAEHAVNSLAEVIAPTLPLIGDHDKIGYGA